MNNAYIWFWLVKMEENDLLEDVNLDGIATLQ